VNETTVENKSAMNARPKEDMDPKSVACLVLDYWKKIDCAVCIKLEGRNRGV
jgi:hypothetical protein